MNQSESIAKLASALSKVQGKLNGAKKDSSNPFFKSKYADLESVWDACRYPLAENELSVIQTTDLIGDKPCLITTLAHSSGEWIRSVLPLFLPRQDSQTLGSALTYTRRYALAAIVGIVQVDDDGNMASRPPVNRNEGNQVENMNFGPEPDVVNNGTLNFQEKQHIDVIMISNPSLEKQMKKKLNLENLHDMKKADYKRLIEWVNSKKEEKNAN